jgi:hypothetical protein
MPTRFPLMTSPDNQPEAIESWLLDEGLEGAMRFDNLDDAVVAVAQRFGRPDVVAYDWDKCVELIQRLCDDCPYEEAVEYLEYNVCGAYVGETTPIFLRMR